MERTTIPCMKETKALLKGLAKKNENWNDFLNRLAREHVELYGSSAKNTEVVVVSKCRGSGLIQICNDKTMQICVTVPTIDNKEISVWKTFGSDNGVLERMKNELYREG